MNTVKKTNTVPQTAIPQLFLPSQSSASTLRSSRRCGNNNPISSQHYNLNNCPDHDSFVTTTTTHASMIIETISNKNDDNNHRLDKFVSKKLKNRQKSTTNIMKQVHEFQSKSNFFNLQSIRSQNHYPSIDRKIYMDSQQKFCKIFHHSSIKKLNMTDKQIFNHSHENTIMSAPSVKLKHCYCSYVFENNLNNTTYSHWLRQPQQSILSKLFFISILLLLSSTQFLNIIIPVISAQSLQQQSSKHYSRYYPPYVIESQSQQQNQNQNQPSSFNQRQGRINDYDDQNKLSSTFDGGEIFGQKILAKQSSYRHDDYTTAKNQKADYEIRSNILIHQNSHLIIEPGVRLAFSPGIGIIVHGSLNATGTSTSKIILTISNGATKLPMINAEGIHHQKPLWPNIRLVDGQRVEQGRLQLKYKGHWHSVCTNSRNWTRNDVEVVCHQLGFTGGHWYRWFKRNNDSRQFMLENPGCHGNEPTVQDCQNWSQRRIGSGVCDFHQDIGISCDNNQDSRNHWRGIEFINSDSRVTSIMSNKMDSRRSNSAIEHVIIEYAGQQSDGKLLPALSSIGSVPPHINHLAIYRSAYTALNITDPINGFEIMNSKFIENRAYGVYVNTSTGRVHLSSVEIEDNGADGVRFVHFDKTDYSSDNFCETPNLGTSQVFPIKYTYRQSASKAPTEECCQEFYSKDWEGQRITVHFPLLMSGVEDYGALNEYLVQPYIPHVGREGSIYIIDGHSGRIIADFFIRNNTKIQSVSSIIGNGPLRICYRPAHYRRVLFTIQVVVDYGREYDVTLSNSRIVANNGRGLWFQDLRSGAVVNRTLISNHDYVAGLNIDRGVGTIIVNNSIISNNIADGVNITNGGGYLHIDRTEIVNNTGRGIAVWFNESINLGAFNYSSHVTRCSVSNNQIGLLIFSGCHFSSTLWHQGAYWNISLNDFFDQREQGLLYHSCIPRPRILKMQLKPLVTNISIGHNRFLSNELHAIHVAPLFFTKLNIAHNEFSGHKKAVLYINSQDHFCVQQFVEDAERFPFSFFNGNANNNDGGHTLMNQRSLALDLWPTVVRIRNNNFHNNRGYYVASIGLLEPESSINVNFSSLSQKILFTRNILHDNIIREPFENLNSRSRVAAVLCVTSSNVLIWRNEFINPSSKYELGVHLGVQYRLVNASLNYWGTSSSSISMRMNFGEYHADKHLDSAAEVYERIFDRKNRYNLAQVEFLPYILIPNALESDRSALSLINDREKILQFFHGNPTGEIGGQVKGQVNLRSGKYFVKHDIYISPEGELVLNPGTVLHFDQSVGIFVQGKFKAKGHKKSDIKFLLASHKSSNYRSKRNVTLPIEVASVINSTMAKFNNRSIAALDQKSPVSFKLKQTSYYSQNIRLSNGTEGLLEVKIGNDWGTVCGYNFDIEDASVACHQLGLVLNERDWRLEKSEFWNSKNSRIILLTNVQCTHLDTDLTKCKAERMSNNDFEGGWCPKGEVGIRCFPEAWAGIRFGMLTQEVILEHITVEKAGLIDYRTRKFGPALQFDFNRFAIRDSIITSNIDSGVGILWNDVISEPNDDRLLTIIDTKIMGNLNHGIVTSTQGIRIENCLIADNKVSGFHYEPNFRREKQEELASWIVKQPIHNRKTSVFIIIPGETASDQSIYLGDIGRQVYVYVPRRPTPISKPFHLLIRTDPGKRIGVMAISPIFLTRSSESLRLYSPLIDSIHASKMMWDIRRNLTTFPFIYPGYRLMLEYSTGELPYGGILLLFTPKQYLRNIPGEPSFVEKSLQEQREMNTMILVNNEFIENGKGISSAHCSMNIDLNGNYCKRYGNETIIVRNNLITKSKGAGLFVNSFAYSSMIPYSLLVNMIEFNEMPQQEYDITYASSVIAEINYTLIENRFVENAEYGSIVLYDHSLYANSDMQQVTVQSMPGFVLSNAIGANYPSNTNLFHWNIHHCTLEGNKNGGVDLKLPYTWLYNENFTHTVVVEDSNFLKNQNFEFVIGGHYARVNITRNKFLDNQCKIGLVSILGMEKLTRVVQNEMNDNYVQRYVIEMNMESHADKFGTVTAMINRNKIRNNRFSGAAIQFTNAEEMSNAYTPETYAIAIRGLQQVNVTRNILTNRNLQFELLAGVKAGSIHNELNARENFWGIGFDPQTIRERIFDFDDWNSFSTTIFSPWLSNDHSDASLVHDQSTIDALSQSSLIPQLLGGRLNQSLVLHARDRPYVVQTDLTIMPDTTLTIRPGVEIEFYPSVGILVLGDLNAIGIENKPILFRPITRNSNHSNILQPKMMNSWTERSKSYGRKRQIPMTEQLVYSKSDHGGVRLCLTETCDPETEIKAEEKMKHQLSWFADSGYPKLASNDRRRHGFMEIYNLTTLQWTPICDPRFTERDAQVVCRQLGFSTLNVFVRRASRSDMDPTLITRVSEWPESLECKGSESNLAECDLRTFSKDSYDRKSTLFENAPLYHSKLLSTNFYRKTHQNQIVDNQTQELLFYMNDDWRSLEERSLIQSTACRHDGDEFVYIFCGEDNNRFNKDDSQLFEHWGGIRFALPEFEEDDSKKFLANNNNNNRKQFQKSAMHYVNIIGAGVLHGEKNAAVQMIQRSIPLEFVTIQNSAYHAVETLAPPESLKIHRLRAENNLGAGLNLLLSGTSTSESSRVPYEPITDGSVFTVPYNAFSMVDICDARKQLRVKEKIIVYYKYDNRPVDCVKIFTSANPLKNIGIRFLQLNLWSKFTETAGKVNTFEEDYIQGKKFAYQTEDIFHNKIHELIDETTDSYVDASLITSMSDSIMIWDGDIFNETTRHLIGEVYSDSTQEFLKRTSINPLWPKTLSRQRRYTTSTRRPPLTTNGPESSAKNILYKSTGFSMSLQLHVSGASGRYGFIAEVTTLPSAYHDERDIQHNITFSDINDNNAGALLYQSVGESVPQLALLNNMFKRNCRNLWGNFSTCEGQTIDLKIQNSPHLYFQNNLITDNRAGGLKISATSFTAVSALNAHLINNLFADNYQKEALYFEGANSYQKVDVDRNYFSRNRSPHRSNMVFGRAIVEFHENVIINNYGDNQLFMAGFAHAQSSSKLQRCTKNFFYNNHAKNERGEQSTIIVSTIGQIYSDNYLVNPDNDFELSTRNRTIINAATYSLKQNLIEPTSFAAVLASAIVQAPYNWWGFNETSAIEARIRDSRDSFYLIPVQFEPFYSGNWSVLSGSCYGGYQKIADTCFVYVGGRMTYDLARKFCGKDNSSMPFIRASNQEELMHYIYLQQPLFNRRRHPVWVQSFDVPIGSCSVLIDGHVRVHDCNDELPFLCERDPEIGISTATLDYWYQEPLGMAVIGISFLTMLLTMACICCWICKSRHRHLEKLERRNSIRASIRSSRSLASMSALNDSQYFTNRKLLSESNPNVNGSINGSINPSYRPIPLHSASGHQRQSQSMQQDHYGESLSSTFPIYTSDHNERLVLAQKRYDDAFKYGQNSRTSNTDIMRSANLQQPTFDMVYDNRAFKQGPTDQSTPMMSPLSFSSREEHHNPTLRTWTPETNSTLDFKVKPALDPQELSQYTESSEDLHKPPPSTSSSTASDLPSPTSGQLSNRPRFYQPRLQQSTMMKSQPIHPPPPPPIRRLIQSRDQRNENRQRRSMDPTMFLHHEDEEPSISHENKDMPMETTFDGELLTFDHHQNEIHNRKEFKKPIYHQTDLDGVNTNYHMGGSQPSLTYGSYAPSTIESESNNPYLETSLDNDSFHGNNFPAIANSKHNISSSTNAATKARLYASQPLETSM
nr:protein bark beetle-like [Dermatophagoides farinae]